LTNITRVPGLTVIRCGLTPLLEIVIVGVDVGVVVVVVDGIVDVGGTVVVATVVVATVVATVVVGGVGVVGVLLVPLLPPHATTANMSTSPPNAVTYRMIPTSDLPTRR
jgi:hypothetical protein